MEAAALDYRKIYQPPDVKNCHTVFPRLVGICVYMCGVTVNVPS